MRRGVFDVLAFDGGVGDLERGRQRRVDDLGQATVEREPSDLRGLVCAVRVDGGVVAGHPFDVIPVARARAERRPRRARTWRAAVETDPAQPVHEHVADPGELGVCGLLYRRHRRLTGAVDGLAQVDVAREHDRERFGDVGVVEDPFDPGLAGFGDELDLALVRRCGDVAEPVTAAVRGVISIVDSRSNKSTSDDGEPVDLLGRVEAVVVVLDEPTEPCPPRGADRVAALDQGLQPGFDLAVERARLGWWGRGRLRCR